MKKFQLCTYISRKVGICVLLFCNCKGKRMLHENRSCAHVLECYQNVCVELGVILWLSFWSINSMPIAHSSGFVPEYVLSGIMVRLTLLDWCQRTSRPRWWFEVNLVNLGKQRWGHSTSSEWSGKIVHCGSGLNVAKSLIQLEEKVHQGYTIAHDRCYVELDHPLGLHYNTWQMLCWVWQAVIAMWPQSTRLY